MITCATNDRAEATALCTEDQDRAFRKIEPEEPGRGVAVEADDPISRFLQIL
jgi:hypothetical protein